MMSSKLCMVLCCLLGMVLAAEKYSSKYDNIDIKELMTSRRLLLAIVDCILDKGQCTPDAKEIKELLPEIIETDCAKCTDAQLDKLATMANYIIENEREIWDEAAATLDPERTFRKKYEDEARKRGIRIPK